MLSNKPRGIAVATMLGTVALFGTSATNAAIDLDNPAANSVTYAKETLLTAGALSVGGESYYLIDGGTDSLEVSGKVGKGISGTTRLILTYTLSGLSFTDDSLDSDARMAFDLATSAEVDIADTQYTLIVNDVVANGVQKINVTLEATAANTGGIPATSRATLNIDELATSASGGTITLTSKTDLVEEADETTYVSGAGSVNVSSGIVVTSSATDAKSRVVTSFRAFEVTGDADELTDGDVTNDDDVYTANLGSFGVAADGTSLDAADGLAVAATDLGDLIDLTTGTSSVTFAGLFDPYAAAVWFDASDCAAELTSPTLRPTATLNAVETFKLALAAADDRAADQVNGDEHFLCIRANKEDGIPETEEFTVTSLYGMLDGHAFAPGGSSYNLGRITRDGVSVAIPYLSTNSHHRHRLYLSNRGSFDSLYTITFSPLDVGNVATTAMGDGEYTDTVPAGQTHVHVVSDLVTLSDKQRTAADIIVEAIKGTFDVTGVVFMDGNSDTTIFTPIQGR